MCSGLSTRMMRVGGYWVVLTFSWSFQYFPVGREGSSQVWRWMQISSKWLGWADQFVQMIGILLFELSGSKKCSTLWTPWHRFQSQSWQRTCQGPQHAASSKTQPSQQTWHISPGSSWYSLSGPHHPPESRLAIWHIGSKIIQPVSSFFQAFFCNCSRQLVRFVWLFRSSATSLSAAP